jgi:CheY-like chemotaxis protein
MDEDLEQALAVGCAAYETKSIDFDRLLNRLQDFTKEAS